MKKTTYVDGFVLVVPKDKVDEYKKIASEANEIWMKHGALSYRECMGDDLNPDIGDEPGCTMLPFGTLTKLKESETIWFSYIEFESKEERDRINAAVMKEMEEKQKEDPDYMKDMPFDMLRMSFGGFSVEVSS